MRRISTVATLGLALIALLPAGRAEAGGAEWFEFKRPYYTPGESGVARTRVWFLSEERAGMATQGRFVGYILPTGRWIRPPGVPSAAIPLGPVTFSSPDGNTAIATLEFTVPNVLGGDWTISVCNVPCTDSMIGDLGGGSIRIAASAEMAAIMRLQDRLEAGLSRAERNARRGTSDLRAEAESLRAETRVLARRVGELEAELEKVTSLPGRTPAITFPGPIGWVLVGLTVLFGLLAFRPRRRAARAGATPMDPPVHERIDDPDRVPVLRR